MTSPIHSARRSPHLNRASRLPLLLLLLAMPLAACSNVEHAPEDAGADAGTGPCPEWCSTMRACDLMGVEQSACLGACEEALDETFVGECVRCLEATSCPSAWDDCFLEGGACYRRPTASYLASIGGFDPEAGGKRALGRLMTWNGRDLDALLEARVSQPNLTLLLSFGTVLSPGLHYRMQYFVDLDDDGACDPAIDVAYERDIFLEDDAVVVHRPATASDDENPRVCEAFTSVQALCERRCQRLATCGALAEPVDTCVGDCVESSSPVYLNRCVPCLEDLACSAHASACEQSGGLCDADHTPPDTELLLTGTTFTEYEGRVVYAQVEDLAGQVLTPLLEKEIEDGRFFFHFGKSIWRGQTYVVVYFIDVDGNGNCDGSDPGWATEVHIDEMTALRHFLDVHDPEAVKDVCERVASSD